jgi:hypothetical protein
MICSKCGAETHRVLVKRTNMSETAILCETCRPVGVTFTEKDGTFSGVHTEVIDPDVVIQQLNPDVSCDFCSAPDPQWLYTLKMEPIIAADGKKIDLGNRWSACDPCSKDADNGSAIGTVLRLGVMGDVTNLMQIHGEVMNCISNKRAYVRDDSDGALKIS